MLSFFNRRSDTEPDQGERTPRATPSHPMHVVAAAPMRQLMLAKSEEEEVSDFKADLEAALRDINVALHRSTESQDKIKKLQENLQERGWWGQVKVTFTGATDSELAAQLMALASSLDLTQQVVRVMLKVQAQKNRLLQAFNKALVDKIASIEGDTRTLDDNQRLAALAFLGELHQQVEEQIRQQDLVESHEQRLQSHEQWLFEVDQGRAESEKQLAQLEAGATDLHQQVVELGAWRAEKNHREAELGRQLIHSEGEIAGLKLLAAELEHRLTMLEESNRVRRSFRAVLTRQLLPLLAVGLAVISLFFSWSTT